MQKFDLEYEESAWNKFYQLTSVIQLGATDSEYLPHTIFSYYKQGDLEWYAGSYDYTASFTSSHGTDDGYINYYSQFADMNGDGLLDKVLTYAGTDTVYVLFNNGSDFEYIAAKSEWTDPFGSEVCVYADNCIGKLNAYYFFW